MGTGRTDPPGCPLTLRAELKPPSQGDSGDRQGQLWGQPRAGYPVPTSSTPLVPGAHGWHCPFAHSCHPKGTKFLSLGPAGSWHSAALGVAPSRAAGDSQSDQSGAALGALSGRGDPVSPSGPAQGKGQCQAAAAAVPAGHGPAGHRGRAGLGVKAVVRRPGMGWGLAGALVLSSISWSSLGGGQALLAAVVAGAGLLSSPWARGARGHGQDRRARGGPYLGSCRAVTTGFILKYCLNLNFAYL